MNLLVVYGLSNEEMESICKMILEFTIEEFDRFYEEYVKPHKSMFPGRKKKELRGFGD